MTEVGPEEADFVQHSFVSRQGLGEGLEPGGRPLIVTLEPEQTRRGNKHGAIYRLPARRPASLMQRQRVATIMSFDAGFDGVPGIARLGAG